MFLRTVVVLVGLVAAASAGETWTAKGDADRRVVETTGSAQVGGLRVDAFVSLSCNRTGAPVAWLDYTVADADNVTKSFDLSSFEGPDAPAQSKQLVTLELVDGKVLQTLHAHASGWYSAEHTGGFGFGIGGAPAESRQLAELIKRATREGTVLRIRVTAFDAPAHTITSEFPLAGARDALASLAATCR